MPGAGTVQIMSANELSHEISKAALKAHCIVVGMGVAGVFENVQ